jgi:uracil-DNA glycosylase family 4
MAAYNELLEATITRLQDLKKQGVRYVTVSAETLQQLGSAAPPKSLGPSAPPRPIGFSQVQATARPATPVVSPKSDTVTTVSGDGSKEETMAELRERALVCQKCANLASSRKNVVFGVGNIHADLMFVGEAPGAEEDIQGEPFVGRAGQLLTKIIETMGLSREQVYIANILKCRPDTPGQSYGNRPPKPEEMERCLPYLHAQIDLIKPKVIVALGATAVEGLFGKVPGFGITKMRGNWREYRGIPMMPTYHPSYLLRPNPNNIKREAWEDMLQVMERLGMPINEKQKSYFTSKVTGT